jgi:hypothetical protein
MAILQVDLEIIERFTRTRVVKLLHVEINKWDVEDLNLLYCKTHLARAIRTPDAPFGGGGRVWGRFAVDGRLRLLQHIEYIVGIPRPELCKLLVEPCGSLSSSGTPDCDRQALTNNWSVPSAEEQRVSPRRDREGGVQGSLRRQLTLLSRLTGFSGGRIGRTKFAFTRAGW